MKTKLADERAYSVDGESFAARRPFEAMSCECIECSELKHIDAIPNAVARMVTLRRTFIICIDGSMSMKQPHTEGVR